MLFRSTTGDPTTGEQLDENAPPAGRHAAGAARYAYASPETDAEESAAPAPAGVVVSEVVTETGPAGPADPAEEEAPTRVAETPAPGEAPVPSFTPAPEAFAPETFAPETAASEAFTSDDLAPVQDGQTAPVPVPSPRAADEDQPAAQPAAMLGTDHTAPLLSDMAELRTRWQRVQGDFVDDPQAAVSNAADLVDQTAEALVEAVRQRQRQLRAAWDGGAADGQSPAATAPVMPDTEGLRLMMQRYRALFNQLCQPS